MTDFLAPRRDGEADLERALEGLRDAHAENTVRAYASAWRDWLAYAAETGIPPQVPLEPGYLLAWLSACEQRGLSTGSLRTRVAMVRNMHRYLGHPSPTDDPKVGLFMRAAGRRASQATPKTAITADILLKMLDGASLRDRAILLVGYVSGLRRSELVALRWGDLTLEGGAVVIHIRRSKTDQERVGRYVGLPRGTGELCPVDALQDLCPLPHRQPGDLVFDVSTRTIARVVQRACKRVGLNPAGYGAHSLRRGMITDARRAGVPNSQIMHQSGHKREDTLSTYTEPIRASQSPAALAVLEKLREANEKTT